MAKEYSDNFLAELLQPLLRQMFALRRIKSQKAEILKEHGKMFTNYALFRKRTGSGESIFVPKKFFKNKPAHILYVSKLCRNVSYSSQFSNFLCHIDDASQPLKRYARFCGMAWKTSCAQYFGGILM